MDGLKYAKSHEYVKMDGDVATVGISDFAQVRFTEQTAVKSRSTRGVNRQREPFTVFGALRIFESSPFLC